MQAADAATPRAKGGWQQIDRRYGKGGSGSRNSGLLTNPPRHHQLLCLDAEQIARQQHDLALVDRRLCRLQRLELAVRRHQAG